MASDRVKGRRRKVTPDASTSGTDSVAEQELLRLIQGSSPFKQLRDELDQYPLELFQKLCDLHESRKGPVPDFLLGLVPYIGGISLRALEETGLIEKLDREYRSVHTYAPTLAGKALWERLKAEQASQVQATGGAIAPAG